MSDPKSLSGGRYQLVERLGEGGMATVYKAFDQRLQVWRAIKVLLPEYARKRKLMSRFEAEAQTMALLEHPNIVRVYDVDRDEGHAFIVMELVEGGSLVEWLEAHGAMPPRLAVDVMVEMCQALQYAHDHGVIHRDIKPHNVMVDAKGVCRVTDFGIARAGEGDQSLTKTGAVMGTWGYMAPEQRTDAKNVDARADVYALAATMYSLLTDRTPMDLFAADRDPELLAGVHDTLLPIVRRATDYDRDRRHRSAKELASALLAVREDLPVNPPDMPSLAPAAGERAKAPPKEDPLSEEAEEGVGRTLLPEDEPELIETPKVVSARPVPTRPAPSKPPAPVREEQPTDDERPASGLPARSDRRVFWAGGGVLLGLLMFLGLLLGQTSSTTPNAPTPVQSEGITPILPDGAQPPVATPAPVAALTPSVVATPVPADPQRTPRPQRTPTPVAQVDATPAPTPPPAAVDAQCFKKAEAFASPNQRMSMAVRASTCANSEDVTLHYRASAGGPWYQKGMVMRLNAYSTVVELTGDLAAGVDWYLSSRGVTHGSTTRPKHYTPPAE